MFLGLWLLLLSLVSLVGFGRGNVCCCIWLSFWFLLCLVFERVGVGPGWFVYGFWLVL